MRRCTQIWFRLGHLKQRLPGILVPMAVLPGRIIQRTDMETTKRPQKILLDFGRLSRENQHQVFVSEIR